MLLASDKELILGYPGVYVLTCGRVFFHDAFLVEFSSPSGRVVFPDMVNFSSPNGRVFFSNG